MWERNEAPLPLLRPRYNCIHPRQLSPFRERLELPFPNEVLGFEDIVSSGTDHFTSWVKMDPHDSMVHHLVSMFKKLPQTFARHQKGGLLHLHRQTVSAKIYAIVHLCRSGSASTTGTQGPVAEKKMPSKSRSQASGMISRCKKQLSMSIVTFLQIGST